MPVIMECTTVEVTVSSTNVAQPIVTIRIATIIPLRKRIAKTMDVAGIIPPIVVKTIVSHAAIKSVTTGVIIAQMTAVKVGRNSTAKINATAKFISRVLMYTKIAT